MLEFILVFALGAVIGWRINDSMTRTVWLEILKDLGVTDQQLKELARKKGLPVDDSAADSEPELASIPVKIEQHQGQLYAFRSDNDQFLGQGTDRDALIESIRSKMTNVKLIVSEGSDLLQKNNT